MSIICMSTIASGVLISKALLFWGVNEPMIRYAIAVLSSYVAFFLLIYVWLRLHFDRPPKHSRDVLQTADGFVTAVDVGTSRPLHQALWIKGQGKFAGGGASSSWNSETSGGGVSSDSNTFSDLGDEAVIIVVIIGLLAAIFGSAGYLIYQAPEILFEAGFEVVLAAGLIRNSRQIQAEGWRYSIFKRTWWLCAIVLIAAMIFGSIIKHQCPEAASFAQYREFCWNK